jgi:hypothetical protein
MKIGWRKRGSEDQPLADQHTRNEAQYATH